MSSKEAVERLVNKINTQLDIKVSTDDPLIILMLMQQEQHQLSIETFQQSQLQLIETITATLKARSKIKQFNTSLYLEIANSFFLIILLILVVLK